MTKNENKKIESLGLKLLWSWTLFISNLDGKEIPYINAQIVKANWSTVWVNIEPISTVDQDQ